MVKFRAAVPQYT